MSPRKGPSKFKPAPCADAPAASTSAPPVPRHPRAPRSTLPVFATPGFGRCPTHAMDAPPPPDVLDIPDSPPAPLLAKRPSADLADRTHPAPPKRFKPAVPDHVFTRPSKGKAPATPCRHRSPDRGSTSSEVDSLNLGSRAKPSADPFKSSRRAPLFPSPLRLASPRKASPHKHSDDDFDSKSREALQSWLATNTQCRQFFCQLMSDCILKSNEHDIIQLSRFISLTDNRINALEQRIASLDAVQDVDVDVDQRPRSLTLVHPMLSEISTAVSATNHFDTNAPPPSMPVSDTSNTTLDSGTTHVASYTEDVPTMIDSPEILELDLNDMSSRTLVVGDSDDAYYDKFDPLPDDLVFFDVNKSQPPPPPPPTASCSYSLPATSRGRIDHTSSPYYKEVIHILKNTFKLSTFRSNQLECIIATLDGKDVFYLAPTGGGKSLCFQLPALCVTGKTQGTTFVISPLISLITDQVAALRKRGVPAFPLTSAAEENEVRQAMRMMRSNIEEKPKLVYTTPERLIRSESLKDVVNQLYEEKQVARFVIDEAHVIGSWGRDFRGSYAELNILRENWPDVPIMALTGSANRDAIEDIKHNLAMRNPVCLAQSFNRPNLHYSVRKKPSLKKDLVSQIAGFIKTQHPNDTGIIYAWSKHDSEEMAQKLREDFGIEARPYHAGIENEEKKNNQDDWMAGTCKVIVATIAFGMGIDKPDVRFVIHATLPKDMDGYYQETGRAGRDGRASDCVLFYTFGDSVKIGQMLRHPNDSSREKPSDIEIDRQLAKLQGVVAYCSNESDCRRALLRHFDEEFKPEDCHNQCDNCHRPGTLIRHDFTTEAQQVLQLLQEMVLVGRVTAVQLKDTWKGKNNKGVQPYKGLSLYASGKALAYTTIERIFGHLANDGAIATYRVQSSRGYSNSYIQLGAVASDYLDQDKQLVLSWKEKEEGNAPKVVAKPAPCKKGKEPDPRPKVPYLGLYEDIEDADDLDPSELDVIKNVTDFDPPASQPMSSRIPLAESQSASAVVPEDELAATRLERLREKRDEIAQKFQKYPKATILQDDSLQMLALMNPTDEHGFKGIIGDCEDPDEVNNKWNSYGAEFLAALRDPLHRGCKVFDTAKLHRDFAFIG